MILVTVNSWSSRFIPGFILDDSFFLESSSWGLDVLIMVFSSVMIDGLDSSGFILDSSLDGLVLEDSSSSLVTSTSVASFLESG